VHSAEAVKAASLSQPALRSEYKGTTSIQLDGAVSLANGNKKVSVSLRDSDLKQTMRMLADKAGLNIIFHNSVNGTVTLDLVNVTLNDAFKMIVQATDLSYTIQNDTLLVMSKSASLESDINKQNMMVIPIKYVEASRLAQFLNKNVFSTNRPGLSNSQIVVTNPNANELVIFGTKNDYLMAQKIIAKIDVKPRTTSFKVNYTTPKEMAELVCKSLFPTAKDSTFKGGETGGAVEMTTSGDATGGISNVNPVELGGGEIACTLLGSASSAGQKEEKLASLGTTALTIIYFPQTGRINVNGGSESQTDLISEFIKENDKKQPPAYVDLHMVELNEQGSKIFNNTWNMYSPFFSAGFGATGLISTPTFLHGSGFNDAGLPIGIGTKYKGPVNVNYQMNYLIENGKGRTLANPKIIVTNGTKSVIDLTSDYIQSTEAQIMGTGGLAGGVQKTYNIEKDNGMSIAMIPYINNDGYVTLNIQPKYSTIKEQINDNIVDESGKETQIIAATLLQRRNLDLINIRIKDGETLVLGGLIQEKEEKKVTKLPLLGDIPYVGSLFRNTTTTLEKQELVIMITPRIIKDTEDVHRADSL
jgi:type II secretory pathway component GspD/PulD (secretin)